jgi:hypothetical protein
MNLSSTIDLHSPKEPLHAWGSEKMELIWIATTSVLVFLLIAAMFWIVSGLLGAP